jgi:hypothetical protein
MTGIYGDASVIVNSQTNVQGARSCFVESSACTVTAAFVDMTGAAFTPSALRYRIDDIRSGQNIQPWTGILPAASVTVTITSMQNQILSFTEESEAHQILFQITDSGGNVSYARQVFDLLRVVGFNN